MPTPQSQWKARQSGQRPDEPHPPHRPRAAGIAVADRRRQIIQLLQIGMLLAFERPVSGQILPCGQVVNGMIPLTRQN
eukprot:scaffold589328_cov46-Prasinocladus_malaysianus.AAC.1